MPDSGPIIVVGRLQGTLRDNLPDVLFLEELEHPGTGVGLVYPVPGETKAANAFVFPRDAHAYLGREAAASGTHWAIGELELSPASERKKHRNPWKCHVRPGTLRLLSELPEEWNIAVGGPMSARRISASARYEIEAYVREQILREEGELAVREEKNRETIGRIKTELSEAETAAQETRNQLNAEVEAARNREAQNITIGMGHRLRLRTR